MTFPLLSSLRTSSPLLLPNPLLSQSFPILPYASVSLLSFSLQSQPIYPTPSASKSLPSTLPSSNLQPSSFRPSIPTPPSQPIPPSYFSPPLQSSSTLYTTSSLSPCLPPVLILPHQSRISITTSPSPSIPTSPSLTADQSDLELGSILPPQINIRPPPNLSPFPNPPFSPSLPTPTLQNPHISSLTVPVDLTSERKARQARLDAVCFDTATLASVSHLPSFNAITSPTPTFVSFPTSLIHPRKPSPSTLQINNSNNFEKGQITSQAQINPLPIYP